MSKSPEAFRTIREVADWLGVAAHVLRFWESKFSQIRPVKRAGGRRYYRPADMELVGGIKVLLHDRGLTIRGVQRMIREEGTAAVAALSPPLDTMASTEDLFEGSAEEAAWRADETQEDLPKADAAATQQAAPRRAAADDRQTHLALDTPETDQPVPDTAPEPDRPAPDTAPAPAASPPTDAMATPAPASSTCADGLARLATLVGGTTEGRLRPDTITALRALLARMGTDPA